MANRLITTDLVTKMAILELKNQMVQLAKVNREFDPAFEGKVGDTINIRRRVRYDAIDGPDITGSIQDTEEGRVPLVLDKFKTVPIQFSSKELTLEADDFNERYIRPAMIRMSQEVHTDIAFLSEDFWQQSGTPGTTPSTFLDIGACKVLLDDHAVPIDRNRNAFYNPAAAVTLADGLKGVFPTRIAETAIEEASIGRYAGFNIFEDQNIINHTVGDYSGTPLVDGAAQSVSYPAVADTYTQSLVTDGWTVSVTGLLLKGDRFTIDGVNSLNPISLVSTGELQQFVVKDVSVDSDGGGAATITISPPIITTGPQATVDAAPADDAPISVISGSANTQYPQNMLYHRDAITVAFANLEMPRGGADSSRQSMDGISVRVVSQYDVLTDVNIWRFDILYGLKVLEPFGGVVHVG